MIIDMMLLHCFLISEQTLHGPHG